MGCLIKERTTVPAKPEPGISVVVPVYNEEDNVGPLAAEIAATLKDCVYEMIFIDDCSTDTTLSVLKALKSQYETLRVLHHNSNAGQSRSVRSGVLAAQAPVIATLDGDGQNDPADIPALYRQLTRRDTPRGLALVSGRRVRRKDSVAKRFTSRIGNGVRKWLLRDGADDTGCGLKVFRREPFLQLPYFDHIHRYIPALMLREGHGIEFTDVSHRPRLYGRSKYTNFGRLIVSLSDIRGVMWLNRRARRPGSVEEI